MLIPFPFGQKRALIRAQKGEPQRNEKGERQSGHHCRYAVMRRSQARKRHPIQEIRVDTKSFKRQGVKGDVVGGGKGPLKVP